LVAVVLDDECVDASVWWLISKVASIYVLQTEDWLEYFFVVEKLDSLFVK
jgi:hypothetical protein